MPDHFSCTHPVPDSRRNRLAPGLLTAAILALAAMPATGAQGDVDLGEPSVLSQRGQRLKLAIPYVSAPGERVTAVGIEIVSIEAVDGTRAPDVRRFITATPQQRNLVFMTSAERVDAAELTIRYRFAGQSDSLQTWRVMVPPALMAQSSEISTTPMTSRAAASGRTKRN